MMAKTPTVTVIVPAFNVQAYVAECISSILSQSLPSIELVIVDDCSIDETYRICERFAKNDARVRLIRNTRNLGQGRSRNRGIEYSQGDYVTFVDSDDYVEPRMYERMVGVAIANDADIVRCKLSRTFKRRTFHQASVEAPTLLVSEALERYVNGYFGALPAESLGDMPSMSPCTAIYRGDLLREGVARFPSDRSLRSEDLFFNLDYLESVKRCVLLNEVYFHYYSRLGSTSRSYSSPLSKCRELRERAGQDSERLLRVDRTVLTSIKEASIQLAGGEYSLLESVQEIRSLENDLNIREIARSYPRSQLPIRERLFANSSLWALGWPEVLLAHLYNSRQHVSI